MSELKVVFQRLERFLRLEELKSARNRNESKKWEEAVHVISNNSAIKDVNGNANQTDAEVSCVATLPSTATNELAIEYDNVTLSWQPGEAVVKQLSIKVPRGQLLAVVGPVGCGKSTLLTSMLGELEPQKGTARMNGTMAYSSQEPWILSSTFKNNILFAHPFDQEWYNTVVSACQLEQDIELLEDGDETEIGERGVNLSGGQKARISLARAVYSRGTVNLLDDPLSAVDAKVGRRLFDQCICGILRGSTRVLVTHQIQFLRKADMILALNDDGSVLRVGTYDEVEADLPILEKLLSAPSADAGGDPKDEPIEDVIVEVKAKDHRPAGGATRSSKALVIAEFRKEGKLSWSVLFAYTSAFGSTTLLVLLWVLLAAGAQVLMIMADWWLAKWVDRDVADRVGDRKSVFSTYAILISCFVFLAFVRSVMFVAGAARVRALVSRAASPCKIVCKHQQACARVYLSSACTCNFFWYSDRGWSWARMFAAPKSPTV